MAERVSPGGPGSKDGTGAGDHDTPFTFGRRPTTADPSPFTAREYARLLLLRGRLLDGAYADDRSGRYSLSVHYHMVWLGRDDDLLDRPMEPN